jgi:UDP-2,3-diacylglucosamine pyrophosphatase LpxH
MSFAEEVLGWVIFRVSNSLEKRRWGSILRATEIMKKPPYERKGIDEIYDSAVSRSAYILLGMKPNENLVFGHTHRPFINKERTVANTGSWVKELSSQNTYIDISEGKMELKIFK